MIIRHADILIELKGAHLAMLQMRGKAPGTLKVYLMLQRLNQSYHE